MKEIVAGLDNREEDLKREFIKKLNQHKKQVERDLERQYEKILEEAIEEIRKEKAELARQKAELCVKLTAAKNYKATLTKEFNGKEQQYIDTIKRLQHDIHVLQCNDSIYRQSGKIKGPEYDKNCEKGDQNGNIEGQENLKDNGRRGETLTKQLERRQNNQRDYESHKGLTGNYLRDDDSKSNEIKIQRKSGADKIDGSKAASQKTSELKKDGLIQLKHQYPESIKKTEKLEEVFKRGQTALSDGRGTIAKQRDMQRVSLSIPQSDLTQMPRLSSNAHGIISVGNLYSKFGRDQREQVESSKDYSQGYSRARPDEKSLETEISNRRLGDMQYSTKSRVALSSQQDDENDTNVISIRYANLPSGHTNENEEDYQSDHHSEDETNQNPDEGEYGYHESHPHYDMNTQQTHQTDEYDQDRYHTDDGHHDGYYHEDPHQDTYPSDQTEHLGRDENEYQGTDYDNTQGTLHTEELAYQHDRFEDELIHREQQSHSSHECESRRNTASFNKLQSDHVHDQLRFVKQKYYSTNYNDVEDEEQENDDIEIPKSTDSQVYAELLIRQRLDEIGNSKLPNDDIISERQMFRKVVEEKPSLNNIKAPSVKNHREKIRISTDTLEKVKKQFEDESDEAIVNLKQGCSVVIDKSSIHHLASKPVIKSRIQDTSNEIQKKAINDKTASLLYTFQHHKPSLVISKSSDKEETIEDLLDYIPTTLLTSILAPMPFDDVKTIRLKNLKLNILVHGLADLKFAEPSDVVNENSESTTDKWKKAAIKARNRLRELSVDLFWSNQQRHECFQEIFGKPGAEYTELDALTRAKKIIEGFEEMKMRNEKLLDLVTQRQCLRTQLDTIAGEYDELDQLTDFNKSVSSIYVLLRACNKKIMTLMQRSVKMPGEHRFTTIYGLELMDLIAVDYWEEEYIHKLEGRVKAANRYHPLTSNQTPKMTD